MKWVEWKGIIWMSGNLSVRIRSAPESETMDKPLCLLGVSALIWKTGNLGGMAQSFLLVVKHSIRVCVIHSLSDSASYSSLARLPPPATLNSLLFPEHLRPTPGPLHLIFLLPGTLCQTSPLLTPSPLSDFHAEASWAIQSKNLPTLDLSCPLSLFSLLCTHQHLYNSIYFTHLFCPLFVP